MNPRPPSPRLALVLLTLGVASWAVGCASPARAPRPIAVAPAPEAVDPELGAQVARLRSDQFVERSRAADHLVAAGERAIAPLGAAGDGAVEVYGATRISSTRPVLRAILKDLDAARLTHHLASPYPVVRAEAAEELGRRGRWTAVPRLIDRLGDESLDVRASASSSLRRLTNRFFDYDARATEPCRAQAASRWREWWSVEGRLSDPDEGGGRSG